jgi:hypothetical protein
VVYRESDGEDGKPFVTVLESPPSLNLLDPEGKAVFRASFLDAAKPSFTLQNLIPDSRLREVIDDSSLRDLYRMLGEFLKMDGRSDDYNPALNAGGRE